MTVHCSLLVLRGIAQHCIKKIVLYSESCILHFCADQNPGKLDIFDPLTQLEMSEVSWEERCKRSLKTG